MSQQLKQYLCSQGIATSRTTAYNPQGNGQIERYNGIIWKAIELALKSRGLSVTQWESVLQESLNAVRSLLCTATNTTPHERMFTHPRRSANGSMLPSWLTTPGSVFMRRNVRASKYEPLVEEVQLIEANPSYSYVRTSDGREMTVSNRHLAPRGQMPILEARDEIQAEEYERDEKENDVNPDETCERGNTSPNQTLHNLPRRSGRVVKPPGYLQDYV